MNIFVTDPDPVKSAQVLPDKHIVKMPLESCQMLAIVCSESGVTDTVKYTRKMVNHTKQIRVHSEDILVQSGQMNLILMLGG